MLKSRHAAVQLSRKERKLAFNGFYYGSELRNVSLHPMERHLRLYSHNEAKQSTRRGCPA